MELEKVLFQPIRKMSEMRCTAHQKRLGRGGLCSRLGKPIIFYKHISGPVFSMGVENAQAALIVSSCAGALDKA